MHYIIGETGQTETQGFDNLLAWLPDDPVFLLAFFPSVLNLYVHLPAYVLGQIEKCPRGFVQLVEIKLRGWFVD